MRTPLILALPLLLLAACQPAASDGSQNRSAETAPAAAPVIQPVLLTAADGVKVHGRHAQIANPKAIILLFHQAGSGKDEYAAIQPRLAELGYASLAIDQRAGGAMFGPNETVQAMGAARPFLEARRDLDAALDWAVNQGPPVILWGSSYSASLVLMLAADRPDDAAALLAFSPGEYFTGTQVRDAAARVTSPVFVTSAQDATEIAAGEAIFAAVPARGKQRHVPQAGGVHGSSTLIPARNAAGADQNWQAVTAFLASVAP